MASAMSVLLLWQVGPPGQAVSSVAPELAAALLAAMTPWRSHCLRLARPETAVIRDCAQWLTRAWARFAIWTNLRAADPVWAAYRACHFACQIADLPKGSNPHDLWLRGVGQGALVPILLPVCLTTNGIGQDRWTGHRL